MEFWTMVCVELESTAPRLVRSVPRLQEKKYVVFPQSKLHHVGGMEWTISVQKLPTF